MPREKMNQLQKNSLKTILALIVAALVMLSVPDGLLGAEQKKVDVPQKFSVSDFAYSSENRRDPFEPIYLSRVKRSKEAGALKRGYELEELRLVGILKTDKNRFAMMEDMQGKGIMFKKGDPLNSNLWVADIIEGKVVLAYKLRGEIKNINIDIPKK
ncbi:MAG: hypothetical protein A4E62_00930 [Syntrophorhabdus sp. PtaU1.Bin002]|nr:MAG: hypothetical protein A4E58_00107 [Syntrophorhabdus sp. PtaB.Bin006]OPY72325.1 MAG: hypothetical protein A4E62_00930 [Syntrophorhabdus sp. PtaU1.Bin002]